MSSRVRKIVTVMEVIREDYRVESDDAVSTDRFPIMTTELHHPCVHGRFAVAAD